MTGTVARQLRRAVRETWVNGVLAAGLIPSPVRRRLLNAIGMNIHQAKITAGCFFGGGRVSIGEGSFVNHGCFFDSYAPITLGKQVRLGPQVMLCTSTHTLGPAEQRAAEIESAPIFIGDGAWLGARVTVLPGVTIGSGCVIAAGSVVTEDCLPNGMYAGVPARLKRKLDQDAGSDPDVVDVFVAAGRPGVPGDKLADVSRELSETVREGEN